jgi:thiol peroxidase
VFVVDKEGTIRYTELVKEIASEPDYDSVLTAVKELV